MKRRLKLISLIVAFLGLGSLFIAHASKTELSKDNRERLLAMGKKLFVERCSSCHGERGDKPLNTGLPLSKRKLKTEEVAKAAAGRLKEATDEERHAVTLYICSLMN